MRGFTEFCDEYSITHIEKKVLPFYPFSFHKDKTENIISIEMTKIALARMSGRKNAILDIHLLGLDEVRASVAFCDDSWCYGFGTGHKFAVPDKCIKITEKEMQDIQAIEIITQEMRNFVFDYIKRKPYILFKPSVLKAIKIC